MEQGTRGFETGKRIMVTEESIGVIVPTRNCGDALRPHLLNLSHFKNEIAEVVFVDSESTDGTLEFIKSQLGDWPNPRLLQTAPGLYASWNAGIAEISSKWVYIATVGDLLQPGGLVSLLACGMSTDAHVVVSPPAMVNSRAESVADRWPVHHFLERIDEPLINQLMGEREKWLCMVGLIPSTILGSAASNLYQTKFLQQNPFPENFGHEGDAAWGIQVAPVVRLAILDKVCATFCVHGRQEPLTAAAQSQRFSQLCDLAEKVLAANLSVPTADVAIVSRCLFPQIRSLWSWLTAMESVQEERLKYISILECETRRFQDEIKQLEAVRLFPFIAHPNRGDIVKVSRPLKRWWQKWLK